MKIKMRKMKSNVNIQKMDLSEQWKDGKQNGGGVHTRCMSKALFQNRL